jgi:hypothetical protein
MVCHLNFDDEYESVSAAKVFRTLAEDFQPLERDIGEEPVRPRDRDR